MRLLSHRFRQLVGSANMPKRKGTGVLTGEQDVKQPRIDLFMSPSRTPAAAAAAAEQSDEVECKKTNDNGKLQALLTESSWKPLLIVEFNKPYFRSLENKLAEEFAKNKEIFPPRHQIFNALNLTSFHKVKVVILGQDPYHDNKQAHGLCFSVTKGVTPPPSLKNIFKELSTDIADFKIPSHGDLTKWAQQGVLLLNATLTVQAHQANSHANFGWQTFTDAVIQTVSAKANGVVFILWGGFAQKKAKLIDPKRHTIIQAAHPSPLSVTKFLGCKCFSKTNDALKNYGKEPIDWHLD